jgi:hypothetical protein
MEMWKTLRVSHIPTPSAATTDKLQTRRYTNNLLGTKDRSGQSTADLEGGNKIIAQTDSGERLRDEGHDSVLNHVTQSARSTFSYTFIARIAERGPLDISPVRTLIER